MPKRYWDFIIAVGLIATVGFAAAWLYHHLEPEKPQLSSYDAFEKQEEGYYPGGQSCNPTSIGSSAYGENLSQTQPCQEAREEHRLKTNDLIQQTRSAEASEAVVSLSYSQTQFLLAGLIVGALTLLAASAAALYARNAVTVTREVGRDQMRAYVQAEWAIIDGGLFNWVIAVCYANTGQTPALWIEVEAAVHVFNAKQGRIADLPDASANKRAWNAIAGGGTSVLPPDCVGEYEKILEVGSANGILTIELIGLVRYETIFGEIYESEFAFHTNSLVETTSSIGGIDYKKGEEPVKMFISPRKMNVYKKTHDSERYPPHRARPYTGPLTHRTGPEAWCV